VLLLLLLRLLLILLWLLLCGRLPLPLPVPWRLACISIDFFLGDEDWRSMESRSTVWTRNEDDWVVLILALVLMRVLASDPEPPAPP
jgi:hypothetical protein